MCSIPSPFPSPSLRRAPPCPTWSTKGPPQSSPLLAATHDRTSHSSPHPLSSAPLGTCRSLYYQKPHPLLLIPTSLYSPTPVAMKKQSNQNHPHPLLSCFREDGGMSLWEQMKRRGKEATPPCWSPLSPCQLVAGCPSPPSPSVLQGSRHCQGRPHRTGRCWKMQSWRGDCRYVRTWAGPEVGVVLCYESTSCIGDNIAHCPEVRCTYHMPLPHSQMEEYGMVTPAPVPVNPATFDPDHEARMRSSPFPHYDPDQHPWAPSPPSQVCNTLHTIAPTILCK